MVDLGAITMDDSSVCVKATYVITTTKRSGQSAYYKKTHQRGKCSISLLIFRVSSDGDTYAAGVRQDEFLNFHGDGGDGKLHHQGAGNVLGEGFD